MCADYLEGFRPYPAHLVEEYTRQGWWTGETYVDVFGRAVRRHPDREALVDDHRRLTWAGVDGEVAVLAAALHDAGVDRHDRVLLQLPNRAEYPIAFHAVQHLAAVPVAAVPRLGPAELGWLLELTRPAAWLFPARDGGRDFAAILEALAEHPRLPGLRVAVGDDAPPGAVSYGALLASREPGRSREVLCGLARPDADDVAAIFLTGGATGRSKAVPRTHNSFLGNIRVIHAGGTEDDVLAGCTPVGHGMANQGPLGGWIIHASKLVMVGSRRVEAILETVSRERVSRLMLVPAQLTDLLDRPDLGRYDLSSLRFAGSTSSLLSADVARRAQRFFDSLGCRFAGSAYGCTEGPACGHGPDEPQDRMLRTVGRPAAPGHRWAVLGADGRELPAGATGEIAVSGPSVFTGYYGAPEDDRRIFTDAGLYRTGDLGRIDAEGYVQLTGRLKDIIQRGGEAVVPAEMEELIEGHPAVARAAVVAMPDPRLGERACAYVVARPGAGLTLEGLVAHLKARGAGPLQWPERLELVDALPETAAGKLDRVALRADVASRTGGGGRK